MIGYHLAWENNLVGMVMTRGRQREVINIGLGIKQLCVTPEDLSVPVWAESQHHKVKHPPIANGYGSTDGMHLAADAT